VNFILTLGIISVLVLLDQFTKFAVSKLVHHPVKLIDDLLKLTLVYNEGSAFGLKFLSKTGYIVVSIVLIAFLLKLTFQEVERNFSLMSLGYILITSGAIGNLADRFLRGAVLDFISVARFPVFNLADIWITLGVLLILIASLYPGK